MSLGLMAQLSDIYSLPNTGWQTKTGYSPQPPTIPDSKRRFSRKKRVVLGMCTAKSSLLFKNLNEDYIKKLTSFFKKYPTLKVNRRLHEKNFNDIFFLFSKLINIKHNLKDKSIYLFYEQFDSILLHCIFDASKNATINDSLEKLQDKVIHIFLHNILDDIEKYNPFQIKHKQKETLITFVKREAAVSEDRFGQILGQLKVFLLKLYQSSPEIDLNQGALGSFENFCKVSVVRLPNIKKR